MTAATFRHGTGVTPRLLLGRDRELEPLGRDLAAARGRAGRPAFNKDMYELAGRPEICGYYGRVMRECLLPSGRVRFFPMCDYVGGRRFVARLSGDEYDVTVRKRVVDATYLAAALPATYAAPFEAHPEARCVAPGELPELAEAADRYVLISAGKTSVDTCLWLLNTGVAPEAITWIKPREPWLLNRAFYQGGELVGQQYPVGLGNAIRGAMWAVSTPAVDRDLVAEARWTVGCLGTIDLICGSSVPFPSTGVRPDGGNL